MGKRSGDHRAKDGSIVLKMKTSGWYDVQKWILSFGAEARVLEPAQLKKRSGWSLKKCQGYGGAAEVGNID